MPDALNVQLDQVVEIVKDIIRLKPRLKVLLPDNISRLKERLNLIDSQGSSNRFSDYDAFFRIGLLLKRQSEPLSMGALGEMLSVPLSTATRMVDWLVRSGFVDRLSDPEDRRIVRVALSEKGKELYQAITQFIKQRAEQVLRQFSEEEQVSLIHLCKKLLKALEQLSG